MSTATVTDYARRAAEELAAAEAARAAGWPVAADRAARSARRLAGMSRGTPAGAACHYYARRATATARAAWAEL